MPVRRDGIPTCRVKFAGSSRYRHTLTSIASFYTSLGDRFNSKLIILEGHSRTVFNSLLGRKFSQLLAGIIMRPWRHSRYINYVNVVCVELEGNCGDTIYSRNSRTPGATSLSLDNNLLRSILNLHSPSLEAPGSVCEHFSSTLLFIETLLTSSAFELGGANRRNGGEERS